MDDSYSMPRNGDIVGKGRINLLTTSRAIIQGYSRIDVSSQETMKDPKFDLSRILTIGGEVVFKAKRRFVDKKLQYICTYVRKVENCHRGMAKITHLEKGFGNALDSDIPEMRFFFTGLAIGDYSAIKHSRNINDCRSFLRIGDMIEYIAVHDKDTLYILHFELMIKSFDKLKLRSIAQELIGIVVAFPDGMASGTCQLWMKNFDSLIILYPNMIHADLTDMGDVVLKGDRIKFVYKDGQVVSAQLYDQKSRDRLKCCIEFKEGESLNRDTANGMNRFLSTESLVDSKNVIADLATESVDQRSKSSAVVQDLSLVLKLPDSESDNLQNGSGKIDIATLATHSAIDIECQTDQSIEMSIVKEIMADKEIFAFIAAKKPNLIHKCYLVNRNQFFWNVIFGKNSRFKY